MTRQWHDKGRMQVENPRTARQKYDDELWLDERRGVARMLLNKS